MATSKALTPYLIFFFKLPGAHFCETLLLSLNSNTHIVEHAAGYGDTKELCDLASLSTQMTTSREAW